MTGPLLKEGSYPVLSVVGSQSLEEELALGNKPLFQRHLERLLDGPLGEPLGEDRPGGKLRGKRNRLVEQAVGFDYPVDEPDPKRFVGFYVAAGEDEILRTSRPDEMSEPLRSSGARDEAKQYLGLTEFRGRCRDPEITCEGEFATAPQGVA